MDSTTRSSVCDFGPHQVLGNHADHLPAGRQRGIGDVAHHADVPAAIDEHDAARREQCAEFTRHGGVLGPFTG